MTALMIVGGQDLMSRAGTDLGTSEWVEINQDAVNAFADLTDDHNWIHVDVPRASEALGGTIVHGYFTLALGPMLWKSVVDFDGFKRGLNYGLESVRFPAPFPVGARVRTHVNLATVHEVKPGTFQFTLRIEFEAEGVEKPVCVADALLRLIEAEDG